MHSALISVIVPIYNVDVYLAQCIESILDQTYSNLEIILVDDGSTDTCPVICDEYAARDNRVNVIHKENAGVSSARNTGLKKSTGQYIGFIDGDDFVESDMFEKMLERLVEESAPMCICTKYIIDGHYRSNSTINGTAISGTQALQQLIKMNFPTSLWACLYSRCILENKYLCEDIHFLEDLEFQFRILLNVKKVAICNNSWYHYRQREGSANHQQINEKVMTCLDIVPRLENLVSLSNPELLQDLASMNQVIVLFIASKLALSKCTDNNLVKTLTIKTRKSLNKTLKSRVSVIRKILFLLCAINPRTTRWIFRLRHKMIQKKPQMTERDKGIN